jgi:hypothetical protein
MQMRLGGKWRRLELLVSVVSVWHAVVELAGKWPSRLEAAAACLDFVFINLTARLQLGALYSFADTPFTFS